MFEPNFKISESIKTRLKSIQISQRLINGLRLSKSSFESLSETTLLSLVHNATRIEGNRLSQPEVNAVARGALFPNRISDRLEVKNYLDASRRINEAKSLDLKSLISLNQLFEPTTPTRVDTYLDRQNKVRDRKTGELIAVEKEMNDEEALGELMAWIQNSIESSEIPVPIIAGLTHHYIATRHPFCYANGHMARLLSRLVLRHGDFEFHEFLVLEGFYALDLEAYYAALRVDETHDFYFGRQSADLSEWIEYFCLGIESSFSTLEKEAKRLLALTPFENEKLLRRTLDRRQQKLLLLFEKYKFVSTVEVSELFEIHRRTALNLCNKWVEEGFLIQHGEAKKSRKYELADRWLCLL